MYDLIPLSFHGKTKQSHPLVRSFDIKWRGIVNVESRLTPSPLAFDYRR